MRSDTKRIEQLERRLLSLEKAATGWRSGTVGARRQPRVGVTVPDPTQFPAYPTPPPPLEVDEQGHPLPQPPHANVFPFLFTDASFDVSGSGGVRSVLQEDRTAIPVGRVCNLNRVYVPPYTPIPIFEDNGHYWTTYGASAGGSTISPTPQLKPTSLCLFVRHTSPGGFRGTIDYPDTLTVDGFSVNPYSAMQYMGLGVDAQSQATATCTVSGGGVVATEVGNAGSGYVGGSGLHASAVLNVGGGSGAVFAVVLSQGKVAKVNIVSPGSGYTDGTYTLTLSQPEANIYPRLINTTSTTLFFAWSATFSISAGNMLAGQEMTINMEMKIRYPSGEAVGGTNHGWLTSLSHDLIDKFDDGYHPGKSKSMTALVGLLPGHSFTFGTGVSPLPGPSGMPTPSFSLATIFHPVFYQPEYY